MAKGSVKITKDLIIVTMEGCEGCKQLKKDMKSGLDNVCDIMKDDNCLAIAEKADIDTIPAVLKIKGDKIIKCNLIKRDDKPIAVCDGEEYEL